MPYQLPRSGSVWADACLQPVPSQQEELGVLTASTGG